MNDIKTGTISITGLADLEKRLQEFPDKIARNVLRGAVRAGAVVVQKDARQNAPASAEAHWLSNKGSKGRALIQPGSLKKGIRVKLAPRKHRDRPIEYWVYVSRKLFYWKFIEFGTAKMIAQPFLRPAFDKMKEQIVARIRDYMAARIDKEAAKRANT